MSKKTPYTSSPFFVNITFDQVVDDEAPWEEDLTEERIETWKKHETWKKQVIDLIG
jgi:hypothetical protein